MTQHIVIFSHSENPPIEAIVPMLDKLGHTHEIVRMPFGEHPPAPEAVDGVIILGAPASVYQLEELSWIRDEMAWVQGFMLLNRPIFGICFGCQMLAHILGGECFLGDYGREFSYTDVSVVKNDALFDAETLAKLPVFQAHGDTYRLPEEAIHLLQGDKYSQQAAKFNDVWYGVQFHPEITANIAGRWHRFGLERPELLADASLPSVEEHIALTEERQKPLHAWLEGFLGRLFS